MPNSQKVIRLFSSMLEVALVCISSCSTVVVRGANVLSLSGLWFNPGSRVLLFNKDLSTVAVLIIKYVQTRDWDKCATPFLTQHLV